MGIVSPGTPFSAASMMGAPTPIGAAGMVGGLAGKGGGGRGEKYSVGYDNGYSINTTTGKRTPVDTSKYIINGDKGTYDLVNLFQSTPQISATEAAKARLYGAPDPSIAREKAIYDAAIKQMQGDASALKQMQQFAPKQYTAAEQARAMFSGTQLPQSGFGVPTFNSSGFNLPGTTTNNNLVTVMQWDGTRTPTGSQFFTARPTAPVQTQQAPMTTAPVPIGGLKSLATARTLRRR